jgi:hypothetical protein
MLPYASKKRRLRGIKTGKSKVIADEITDENELIFVLFTILSAQTRYQVVVDTLILDMTVEEPEQVARFSLSNKSSHPFLS